VRPGKRAVCGSCNAEGMASEFGIILVVVEEEFFCKDITLIVKGV
jgi:hypothetical protein